METATVEINIYKITSGKLGFFTLWETNSSRLDTNIKPFHKKPPHPEYPHEYHLNEDDLMVLRNYSDKIKPYTTGITAQSWENKMKYEFYKLITEGRLNKKVQHNGKLINLIFNWTGPAVPFSNFIYK